MSPKCKPWSKLGQRAQRQLLQDLAALMVPHCETATDVSQLLHALGERVRRSNESVGPVTADTQHTATLLRNLGQVRQQNEPASNHMDNKTISVHQLDTAVVQAGFERALLQEHGYTLGVVRYRKAASSALGSGSTPGEAKPLGGRPSVVNDSDVRNAVGAVLKQHTIDSEMVVVVGRGPRRRLVLAKHLTKTLGRIWNEDEELRKQISSCSFRRIVKRHFPHIRRPRRETDVCEHCRHLNKKLYPAAKKAMSKHRGALEALLPSYFHAFDNNPQIARNQQTRESGDDLARFVRYINCRNARASNDEDRAPLSGMTRLSLHQAEARAVHKLKPHVDIVKAYEWHQITARRQGAYLQSLRDGQLRSTACLIQTDFKENVKFPLGPSETSEEWHAQGKMSLSVFGAHVLAPRRGTGNPCHIELFVVLVSEVLDHDAQVSTMYTNTVLAAVQNHPDVEWSRLTNIIFAADCGPHFRSKENVAHYCATLPKLLEKPVEVCWLGEQHGKSGVDRCFGWCNMWIGEHIQRHVIHSIDHLLDAFHQGSTRMQTEDPEGARFIVQKFDPGTHRPSERSFFKSSGFKVTRTYSLVGSPSRFTDVGVSIRNKHFTDMPGPGDLMNFEIETKTGQSEEWRRAYYDKPRAWELPGPQPGDQNAITKRFQEQQEFATDDMPLPRRTFLEACSAKALSLSRAATKKRRKHAKLTKKSSSSSGSSSTSSSSTSSSAS